MWIELGILWTPFVIREISQSLEPDCATSRPSARGTFASHQGELFAQRMTAGLFTQPMLSSTA